jgi:transcriptional regulator with XRE-family HTH domain
MTMGEKLRHLRAIEGALRGMERPMSQQEVARALKSELGGGLSQSYLSQIESGTRAHLTSGSRMLLARFFKVHPGHLVDDPDGYDTELTSALRRGRDRLAAWLLGGAEEFAHDAELSDAMRQIAEHRHRRQVLLLASAIIEAPELAKRMAASLERDSDGSPAHSRRRRAAKP